MKALFVNGSPRKGWNTSEALDSAARGAADAGAEVERVDLADFPFKGCMSCFACKLKNSKTHGLCALKDELRPVLEKAHEADVVVVGSPVYFNYPTGIARSFLERFAFPVYSYYYENGAPLCERDKVIPTGMIFTMNCPEGMMKDFNYPTILDSNVATLQTVFGHSEGLYICDTTQFKDYSRYNMNLFNAEDKAKARAEHWEDDLQKAYDLGKRLVEIAKTQEKA